MTKLIYLAAPYTSPDRDVQEFRNLAATITAAKIMRQGYVCFSPLTHGVAVADHLPLNLLVSHEFWMGQCIGILRHCDEVWVLLLPGWRDSKGVAQEMKLARDLGLPITMIQDKSGEVELLTLKAQTLAEAKLNDWGIVWL